MRIDVPAREHDCFDRAQSERSSFFSRRIVRAETGFATRTNDPVVSRLIFVKFNYNATRKLEHSR